MRIQVRGTACQKSYVWHAGTHSLSRRRNYKQSKGKRQKPVRATELCAVGTHSLADKDPGATAPLPNGRIGLVSFLVPLAKNGGGESAKPLTSAERTASDKAVLTNPSILQATQ